MEQNNTQRAEDIAVEMVKRFGFAAGTYMNDLVLGIAKRSAIICCEQLICVLVDNKNFTKGEDEFSVQITFWQAVKNHIQTLT